ncbi:polysaccharide biosynthesis/export family protein [Mucilaginibacter gotjawali]|uniref:Polysaccharide export outer membrane protein n=1 Tax=Mucilaginibacter gotjawali TaxID=1550579 RepID=A0A839SAV3_9SPHI|nr:polysaccharide biosynthesis/export family protein [Mucilaginibacter gotjawali]MBB3054373.1 polysaccharide export outer membrane protein [Mucilaginibacter gotjawali]
MKFIKQVGLLFLVTIILGSCVSQKNVAYFQTPNPSSDSASFEISNLYAATIQPSDILSIDISSLSQEASLMVNPHLPMQAASVTQQATQYNNPPAAIGYLVDNQGQVTIPLIGKVKVSGLTTFVAADTITRRLDNLLVQPTVNIRILNFKISVLGEVVRPAVYTIPNEKVSIPEAIAMAGDLTIYAKRDNILLVREVNGKRTFNRIDITQRNLFNSPFYYLHPNDILYIEPGKGRITSSDRSIQLAPIIISGLTLIATLLLAALKK